MTISFGSFYAGSIRIDSIVEAMLGPVGVLPRPLVFRWNALAADRFLCGMNKRMLLVVVTLTALAVTPLVHHHSLDPHTEGDGTTSLKTVCGVCLNAKSVLPPEVLSIPPLHAEHDIETRVIAEVSGSEGSLVPSRAPPRSV